MILYGLISPMEKQKNLSDIFEILRKRRKTFFSQVCICYI